MRIITANYRYLRVKCDCGNEIQVALGSLKVKCKCGKSEWVPTLQENREREKSHGGKHDPMLRLGA